MVLKITQDYLKFKQTAKRPGFLADRNARIAYLHFEKGLSYSSLARINFLTSQRIGKICREYLRRKDGQK